MLNVMMLSVMMLCRYSGYSEVLGSHFTIEKSIFLQKSLKIQFKQSMNFSSKLSLLKIKSSKLTSLKI
jgi:hypothetical protein